MKTKGKNRINPRRRKSVMLRTRCEECGKTQHIKVQADGLVFNGEAT